MYLVARQNELPNKSNFDVVPKSDTYIILGNSKKSKILQKSKSFMYISFHIRYANYGEIILHFLHNISSYT